MLRTRLAARRDDDARIFAIFELFVVAENIRTDVLKGIDELPIDGDDPLRSTSVGVLGLKRDQSEGCGDATDGGGTAYDGKGD